MSNINIDFYCLNYENNQTRKKRIEEKGEYFQIPIIFYTGVKRDNERICFIEHENTQRTASICYGHLDMLKHFVENSKNEIAIVMEDDIMIRNTFIEDVKKVLEIFIEQHYDIFLLGYLCHNPIDTYSNFPQLHTKYSTNDFKIMGYPDTTWGAQMYMISKTHCKWLLHTYHNGYLQQSLLDTSLTPFSADWTITKQGKRALLYPQRVIEHYTENAYSDKGQEQCRKLCESNIKKEWFI